MRIKFWRCDLQLAHFWKISSGGNMGGIREFPVAIVELTGPNGVTGFGECAPSNRYGENIEGSLEYLARIDPARLSFDKIAESTDQVNALSPGHFAAKAAVETALLDGAARGAGQALHDFLRLGFAEGKHITSFSIGIDRPEVIREKTLAAAAYPILKLKVGTPDDRMNFLALREAAPKKLVRVDANEGWKTKEQALEMIEWFARDGQVEFVEQPMPAETKPNDLAWLKRRSPLPLFADESYRNAQDAPRVAECFHGVCVKVAKAGGIMAAKAALETARRLGLKTMLGCMIETSVLISAAAHLADLADHVDLDGNLLITNDPFLGVTAERGILSFASAPERNGLQVRRKQ